MPECTKVPIFAFNRFISNDQYAKIKFEMQCKAECTPDESLLKSAFEICKFAKGAVPRPNRKSDKVFRFS